MKRTLFTIVVMALSNCCFCQQFVWAGEIDGLVYGADIVDMVSDELGNLYITGNASGIIDLEPDSDIQTVSDVGAPYTFVAKYNPQYEVDWAFTIAGNGQVWVQEIDVQNNSVVLFGIFFGTIDLDPGPGVDSYVSTDITDVFVSKFNTEGVYQWGTVFSLNGSGATGSMCILDTDELLFSMTYLSSQVDLDPGPGEQIFDAGAQSCALVKMDPDGMYQWAKLIPWIIPFDVRINSANEMIMVGRYDGDTDMDPGPGTYFMDLTAGISNGFVAGFTTEGEFLWATSFTGNTWVQCSDLAFDSQDNILFVGNYTGTIEIVPGNGEVVLESSLAGMSEQDVFMCKLDNTGHLIWARTMGSASVSQFANDLQIASGDRVFIGGGLGVGITDMDPGSGVHAIAVSGDEFFTNGFVLELDANGNYLWSGSIEGGHTYVKALLTRNEQLTISGVLSLGESDLDPTEGIQPGDPEVPSQDTFISVLSLDSCPTLSVDLNLVQTDCGYILSLGAIPNGQEPFNYLWEGANFETTSEINDLEQGSYTVTVVDGVGCAAVATIDVNPIEVCMGDFDNDQFVTVSDLMPFIAAYGCQGDCCPYDLNQDGVVSVTDLITFISVFGSACP